MWCSHLEICNKLILRLIKNIFFLLILVVTAYSLLFTTGCASIGHPSGGPKDTLPPVLLKTIPEQGALFFDKKRVSITFDEYVQLKEADKQFIMSPPPEKRPTLAVKGKSIVTTFNSPLKDSTTYQLNFGNAIVDNNEGNPYEAYRFAFSTWAVLDTMQVDGLVLDAYTDQPVGKMLVYLYENLSDSVVLKLRPDNITRSNEEGNFVAENLKEKPYKIVVIDDANKNYKYDIGQEAIGFLDLPVEPIAGSIERHHHHDGEGGGEEKDKKDEAAKPKPQSELRQEKEPKLVLRMFTEDVQTQYMTSCEQPEKRALKMTFNAPYPKIDSLHIDSMDVRKFVVESSPRQDTLLFWFADTAARIPDTLKLNFNYLKTDTLGQLSPSREKRKFVFIDKKAPEEKSSKPSAIGGFFSRLVGTEEAVDTTPKKPVNWTLQPSLKTSNAGPIEHVSVNFGALLISANPQQITFEERQINPRSKDTTYVKVKYELQRDSIRLRTYRFAADWKENTFYRYSILPNAFWDIYSQTNDTMKGEFTTVDPEKLSSLAIDFSNVEGDYVVQITDSKGKIVLREYTLSENKKMEFKYVNPGSHCIRVIKDENGNGKWDTGNYFKRIQPEYATFLRTNDGKLEFTFRQGWDLELSVDMKVLFPD